MKQDDRRGMFLALMGFAILSFGDAVVKSMAGQWAPTAIAALRYAFGAAGFSAILLAREGWTGFAFARPRLQLIRGLAVAVATSAFFASLFLMPLAEATTIVFISPIITGLLAPLILRERAHPATFAASAAAFAGVLIVLRPNLAELGPAALLPVLSAIAMSGLFIANRAVAGTGSVLSMQASLSLVAAAVLLVFAIVGHASGLAVLAIAPPPPIVVAKCALVAVTASCAHWLIYLGTTRAGAATIAPMTYVQLIVAVTLGWLWFSDRPDATAMLGAAIIVGAGLYLWRANKRNMVAVAS